MPLKSGVACGLGSVSNCDVETKAEKLGEGGYALQHFEDSHIPQGEHSLGSCHLCNRLFGTIFQDLSPDGRRESPEPDP